MNPRLTELLADEHRRSLHRRRANALRADSAAGRRDAPRRSLPLAIRARLRRPGAGQRWGPGRATRQRAS